ncbi:retinol dehydrogenase 13-like [Galleria mellonella]|uniref:Retinol dehydrogenase 13-like n=1 Tax=Galleria mellonella TaxID=7137 RepID=A0A6J1WAT6_GALME|nr:retinol dehydrogenase 13-like [Galleria mellonella]
MYCHTNARLDGKVVIVTGGSGGIGYEAAKVLAGHGARVIIASRNETKMKEAKKRIVEATSNNNVDYRVLDLSSLKSVRKFANETLYLEERIDVLINNAGAVGLPDRLTEDGLNLTMQVNYFGAFLLTYLLLPMLKMSASSRIIIGTASAMYVGAIDFDHWNDVGKYDIVTSLANSKLADALLMVELDERIRETGVTVNGFDPFVVRDTDIFGNMDGVLAGLSRFIISIVGRTREEAGIEIAYLATSPQVQDVSGKNYKFCHISLLPWFVFDKELRKRLWDKSKTLVKITPEEDWESKP